MHAEKPTEPAARWSFVLYKAGDKPAMQRAEAGLRRLCDRYLEGRYTLEVVDVMDAAAEIPPDVLAVPLVVRKAPPPERRVIGDLSQMAKAAQGLGLTEADFIAGAKENSHSTES